MDISIKDSSNISDTTDTSPKLVNSPKPISHFKKLQLNKCPTYPTSSDSYDDDDFEDIKELLNLISIKSTRELKPRREEISSPIQVQSPKVNKREFLIRKKSQPISPRLLKTSRNN